MTPPPAAAMLEADRYKDRELMRRTQAYIASMCSSKEVVAGTIAKIDHRDYKPIQAVANLFLGS